MKNPMLRVRTPGITKSRTIIRLGRSIAAHFRLPVALKAITSVVATVSVLGYRWLASRLLLHTWARKHSRRHSRARPILSLRRSSASQWRPRC